MSKNQIAIFIGSFLAQIVQVGVFSLFLAQKLDGIGVPLARIGWLVGIQWATVLILAPLVPRLSDFLSLSRQNLLSGLLTLAGLILAFGNHPAILALAAVLVGTGLIVRWVACDALIVQVSDSAKVGRAIGFHEALMGFGIAVGPLFFTVLSLDQVLQLTILVSVLSTAVFLFVQLEAVHKENRQNASLKLPEFLFVKIALLAALLGGLIETAAVSLFPFYFSADGFSLYESAWFVSAFGLGGTVLQLPLGYIADRIGYRLAQFMVCLLALTGIAGLYLSPPEFVPLYVILFVFGGAIGAFNTLAVIQVGSELEFEKTTSGMAYIAAFYTFGSVVGPVITAKVLQEFQTNAVLLTYSVLIFLLISVILSDFLATSNNQK